MKITRVETFLVPPRWLFCRVETDEGVVGWGEPVVEGRAEAVRAAVDVLAEYLVGQDPLRIQDHWQVLTKGGFYRGGPVLSSAVAGLDQALWDIAGKTYGQIFREFEGTQDPRTVQGSGDVKYHLGTEGEFTSATGETIPVYLAANPSHLEAADGVL